MKNKYIAFFLLLCLVVLEGCQARCKKCNFNPGERVTFVYRSNSNGFPARADYVLTADNMGCIRYDPDDDYNCEPSDKLQIIRNGGARTPFFPFGEPFNLQSLPGSITLSGGSGMYGWYGMPLVEFFDQHGYLIDTKIAWDMAGDGTWCTVDLPNMAGRYSGTYYARIANREWDGTYEEMGEAYISFNGHDPVDNDSDGWTDDMDCNDNDPNVNPGAPPDCTGTYYDQNCNGLYDYYECNPDPSGCNYNQTVPGQLGQTAPGESQMIEQPIYCY
jgi:hypothetical protein